MSLGDSITLADLEVDPDPVLARLRADEPVCWVPAMEMWLVTRWDDVAHLEAHPELFTAATEPSFLARALGANMLTCDPPEHTRLHALFAPEFRPGGRSGDFVRDVLVSLADRLLDDVDPDRFELMRDYAQPLSALSLAWVLGLDGHGADRVWAWCEGLCADIANFEDDPALVARGEAAKVDLGAALDARLAEADTDDALAAFAGRGATRDEIVNNVRLMISGGINEPRDGIGLVTWVLGSRPDLRTAVAGDPARMRRLVEEVFRVYSPVGTVTRQATADCGIAGVRIGEGDLVAGVLRSVNLDAAHWRDPASIDLDRHEGPHAAFALGVHRCLGEWLGRQEVRVGVERLFARWPDLRLDPDHEVTLHGFEFRGPREVWVLP